MYLRCIKPVIDFLFSLIALILISPLILIVIVILFISNQGSPFFIQERPGMHGKIFKLYKFRTMNNKHDEYGNLLSDVKRITSIGKILRKTSLDEIPQLFNVLKGNMSLVGPRPLLIEYLEFYTPEQRKRHNVKPGITGWAQVNGRNAIKWEEKFKFDIWYAENLSFILDLEIIFLTILKVVKKDNINLSDEITMVKFDGEN
jgi:undecaprenyl phosphate N,N'-diacetylbacillosamine 1-phosphate transferase